MSRVTVTARKTFPIILTVLTLLAYPSCHKDPGAFTFVNVTFRVIPQTLPDSSSVYLCGSNSFMGTLIFPRGALLEKHADGSWRKTFEFPKGLKMFCKLTRGDWLTEAVDAAGNILETPAFTVNRDTVIIIEVHDWEDNILSEAELRSDKYRAERYFEKGRSFRINRLSIDTAFACYQKALRLYEKEGAWRKQLECYLRLSGFVAYKGPEESLQYCRKALELGRRNLPEPDSDIAKIYLRIAKFYREMKDNEKSLDFYRKAADIWTREQGENYNPLTGCYSGMADIYFREGHFDRALERLQKVLSITIANGGEVHQDVSYSYQGIAEVYAGKGDLDKAIDLYQKSLAIQLIYYDDSHYRIGHTNYELGKLYLDKGDYDAAEVCIRKFQNAMILFYGKKHDHTADSYQSLAEVEFKKKNYLKALNYTQQAMISLVEDFDDPGIYVNPPVKHGNNPFYWRRRFHTLLVRYLAFKAEVFDRLAARRGIHSGRRPKYRGTIEIEMSLATYDAALQRISRMRNVSSTENSKVYLAANARRIYDQAIQAALKLYGITGNVVYREKAFLIAEQSKAGILSDALREARAKAFSLIPSNALQREDSLRSSLTFYQTKIQKEKEKTAGRNEKKLKEWEDRYFLLKMAHESLVGELEERYPDYLSRKLDGKTASVAELQQALDEKTVLVEYFAGDSLFHIFTVSKRDFEIATLAKPADFAELCRRFTASIKRVLDEKEYVETGAQLYNLLLKPAADQLSGKQRLIVIPDEELHYLPFEALISPKKSPRPGGDALSHAAAEPPPGDGFDFTRLNYLIKQFEISYHYSAALYLTHSRPIASNPKSQISNPKFQISRNPSLPSDFIGFAPVFSKLQENGNIPASNSAAFTDYLDEEGMALITRDGSRLEELKFSQVEVDSIVKIFAQQGQNSSGFFHRQASEENFKSQIGNYKYVHISTHGFMNAQRPQLSGLAFSQPSDSSAPQDGILYSGEIYNLKLNADLVVLSSCESGIGKLVSGEGVISLTRGFLYSGARNVIVSLWKISDKHTSRLMIELYRQILSGKTYSAALREAKLKLIGNELTAAPSLWSSFVLIGN